MKTVGLSLILLMGSGFGLAADNSHLLHPEKDHSVAEIKGKVASLDLEAKRLTVVDDANHRVTVKVEPDSRLVDSENDVLKPTQLRVGDSVLLYYNTREQIAVQVDILPTPSDALIGTPKSKLR
jgi:hypothetical protein